MKINREMINLLKLQVKTGKRKKHLKFELEQGKKTDGG